MEIGPSASLMTPTEPDHNVWDDILEFFDTLYMIFPILSFETITSRLMAQPNWTEVPDLRTLLLAIRLLNAAGRYRMEAINKPDLCELIRQVETSRLEYDFAEVVTMDDVVCSLCLFTAHNVLEKHNRAFLYLDEAISLFEMVSPDAEEQRRLRIEQVLYNTEAATHTIYAPRQRRRRARAPSVSHEQLSLELSEMQEPNRIAIHLLNCLTQINLDKAPDGLEEGSKIGEVDVEALFETGLKQHRYSRIQAADVVVTRQWRLSSRLAECKVGGRPTGYLSQQAIERLGVQVMSWICLLKDGELRIVGLGKLAGLIQNICVLAGQASCRYVLAGLSSAIMREDYDKTYTPSLTQMIMSMTSSVPQLMGSLPPLDHEANEPLDFDPHDPRVVFSETRTRNSQAGFQTTDHLEDGIDNRFHAEDFDWLADLR